MVVTVSNDSHTVLSYDHKQLKQDFDCFHATDKQIYRLTREQNGHHVPRWNETITGPFFLILLKSTISPTAAEVSEWREQGGNVAYHLEE